MNPQALRDHFERMAAELTLLREVCHILDIEIVEVHDSIMVAEQHNETLANLIQQLWLQAK